MTVIDLYSCEIKLILIKTKLMWFLVMSPLWNKHSLPKSDTGSHINSLFSILNLSYLSNLVNYKVPLNHNNNMLSCKNARRLIRNTVKKT